MSKLMIGIELKREFKSFNNSGENVKLQLYFNTLLNTSMDDLQQCE